MKTHNYYLRVLLFNVALFVALPALSQYAPPTGVSTFISSKDYEIAFPRQGFLGAPPSPAAYLPMGRPKCENDFDAHYIRIVLVLVEKHGYGHRYIVRIDKIDSKGVVIENVIYYAYIDVLQDVTHVIGLEAIDGETWTEIGPASFRTDIPFPLTFLMNPLAIGGKAKQRGNVLYKKHNGEFKRNNQNLQSSCTIIEVVYTDVISGGFKNTLKKHDSITSGTYCIGDNSKNHAIFVEKQKWTKKQIGCGMKWNVSIKMAMC